SDIPGRHQSRFVAVRLELPAQVMGSHARLHADEASRYVGEAGLDLAARQLLPQNDCALPVEANEVERVLADVDAECCNGFKAIAFAWHGMLLILAAPRPALRLAGAGARRVHPISGHWPDRNPAAQRAPIRRGGG